MSHHDLPRLVQKLSTITIRLANGTEILLFVSRDLQGWVSDARLERFLRDRLPALEEHRCVNGRPGGFFDVVREGTNLGHVIEHVALAILGLPVVQAATIVENGFFRIYFPNIEGHLAEKIVREAIAVLDEFFSAR